MFLDWIRLVRIAALAALLAAATGISAQEIPTTPDAERSEQLNEPPAEAPVNPEAPTNPAAAEPTPTSPTPPPGETAKHDPCADQAELRKWIDTLQSSLYRFSCSSVSWFDGLFGSRPFDDEYRATHGTVIVGGRWSERDGINKTLRFKARVYFPQISEYFNAFIGRADREEIVDETQPELFRLPTQFSSGADDSVFVGLGFNDRMKKRGSFDFDAGVRIADPLDPYVKGSYRFSRPIGERDLLRLRETLFWQQREGFGTTALIEWNHVFDRRNLVRWTNSATFSENTLGMRWYSDVNFYHLVNDDRAFAYQLLANGSTQLEVPLTTYGATVIYRQRVWRKWLFLELRGGVDWPRYFLTEERRLNPNGALSFEMRFGRD